MSCSHLATTLGPAVEADISPSLHSGTARQARLVGMNQWDVNIAHVAYCPPLTAQATIYKQKKPPTPLSAVTAGLGTEHYETYGAMGQLDSEIDSGYIRKRKSSKKNVSLLVLFSESGSTYRLLF